ncbi:hypothetical protein [Phaeacidiphilus oryzae]|jgi:ABC-type nickel/cobalt efflux system permease component RcnA|uniref:hypothetical protein n=1 Tax=Phaeacidiphilus oryzae TaxID=348818 RepID=UPI00055E57CE|nr:hypothetical protein [Phaeacidiphilus oryzae]
MLLMGLLLVCAVAAFTGLVIADNLGGGPSYGVDILGSHVATLNMLEAFLCGLALALVFCAGLWLLFSGGLRTRRRAAELRAARKEAAAAAKERDKLLAAQDGTAATATTAERRRGGNRMHIFGH